MVDRPGRRRTPLQAFFKGLYGADDTWGMVLGPVQLPSSTPLDVYAIMESHEYAETVTDLWGKAGWKDSSGKEIGDKCEAGDGATLTAAWRGTSSPAIFYSMSTSPF